MVNEIEFNKLVYFFEDLQQKNPLIVLLLMTLSLGLYLIYWTYQLNIRLELLDNGAPDSNRCISILIILPAIVYITIFFLEDIIFPNFSYFIYIKILFWGFITFLSLKYFFDFTTSFGKITKTNGTIWYLLMYPGYYSVVLAAFNFYATLSLLIFPIITIPIMQAYLNKTAEITINKNESKYFNSLGRKN